MKQNQRRKQRKRNGLYIPQRTLHQPLRLQSHHKEGIWIGVALLSIALLFGILYLSPNSAGKAIQGLAAENSVSVSRSGSSFLVQATLAQAMDGVTLQLTGPDLCATYVGYTSSMQALDWEYVAGTCEDDTFTFGAASMVTPSSAGAYTLVELQLGQFSLPLTLTLHDVSVYSGGNNLFDPAASDAVTFTANGQTQQAVVEGTSAGSSGGSGGESSGSSDSDADEDSGGGGGGGLSCTRNWQCSEWSGCSQGKESRVCTDANNCQATRTIGYRTYPVQVFGGDKPTEERACAFAGEQLVQGGVQGGAQEAGEARQRGQELGLLAQKSQTSGVPAWLWVILGVAALGLLGVWLRHWHRQRQGFAVSVPRGQ